MTKPFPKEYIALLVPLELEMTARAILGDLKIRELQSWLRAMAKLGVRGIEVSNS
jgi:hypothetical protein